MKFCEMVDSLMKDMNGVAYNKKYPNLMTNIRIRRGRKSETDVDATIKMLYYYNGNTPTEPVVIVPEVWNTDGWEVVGGYSERLNITAFMNMPNAKRTLEETYELSHKKGWNGNFSADFVKMGGFDRLREALELGVIKYRDEKRKTFVFTDLGEELIKTI